MHQNGAVSDLEGGVRLPHSNGRDLFEPFGSSFHPNWRESEAQLTEKQAVLLMHDIYMGLEFQVDDDKVCYTPLKDKCEAIRNLDSPKTLKQTRAFCGMVNFLSSFLPILRRLLLPIYDIQKKSKKFKWTDEAEKAFNDIKKLLVNPPVLKAHTPDGLFSLEGDTSQEGVGGTLLQKQGNEWVLIGYHSKRLPPSA